MSEFIRIENVSFDYSPEEIEDPHDDVIKNISLTQRFRQINLCKTVKRNSRSHLGKDFC